MLKCVASASYKHKPTSNQVTHQCQDPFLNPSTNVRSAVSCWPGKEGPPLWNSCSVCWGRLDLSKGGPANTEHWLMTEKALSIYLLAQWECPKVNHHCKCNNKAGLDRKERMMLLSHISIIWLTSHTANPQTKYAIREEQVHQPPTTSLRRISPV